jgi:ABC-type phosphate/phosphonate transport system substrate-binding protein
MEEPIVLGAVVYDPKVTVIWGIIRDFFESRGCPLDVSFYKTYELQVDAHERGEIEVAWNSPLAWVDAQRRLGGRCRAVAMRDTDRDRVSHVVARVPGPRTPAELRGATIGFGAKDSPQATLIPIETLRRLGLEAGKDYRVRLFDVGAGLHGDHVGGELDALRALEKGEVEASVMLDLNWERWSKDGTADPRSHRVVATTDRFDHCNFTVRGDFPKEREARFLEALFSMTYDDPKHREMMDLEGLRQWLPGRTSGYAVLEAAVRAQGFFAR